MSQVSCAPLAVARVGGDLGGQVVGVEAEHADVAVDHGVHRWAARRAGARQVEPGGVARVAVRRAAGRAVVVVERLHVVVARGEQPGRGRRALLDHAEVLRPDGRVEVVEAVVGAPGAVVLDRVAVAAGVGVADVAREQVERGPLRRDQRDQRVRGRGGAAGVVGLVVVVAEAVWPGGRVDVHALVGERGERERRRRGPGGSGGEHRVRGGRAVREAEAVVHAGRRARGRRRSRGRRTGRRRGCRRPAAAPCSRGCGPRRRRSGRRWRRRRRRRGPAPPACR